MKRLLWAIGGFCAAALGLLVLHSRPTQQANILSRHADDTWHNPYTVV